MTTFGAVTMIVHTTPLNQITHFIQYHLTNNACISIGHTADVDIAKTKTFVKPYKIMRPI
jgi:hypothetical protein